MKRLINKILFGLTLTGGSLGLHSCGDWLDINSNELAATKTEAGYLFNYAAINYSSKRVGGDQWLPIIYAAQVASDADNWFVGDDMYNISTYATGNGWVTSYSSCGYNLLKAIEFATGENDGNSVAQCKILLANTVWESSMLYGDIPYSEAWNIEGTQTPKFDTQKDVFYSVIGLLDEALDGIDESNSKRIDKYDIYYTGDMAKWRRLGNSLKLKFYMYLANKEDVGDEIKAIIDGGELMNSSADDFVFPFYTTPGNQNPNYQLTVQYPDYYEYCFFANPTVLDPMKALDDPRIPIYFRANADGEYISGGNMAAPVAGDLLADILDYMDYGKQYTAEELTAADTIVPYLTGYDLATAEQICKERGFTCRVEGDGDDTSTVNYQTAAGGTYIPKGNELVLYIGDATPPETVTIPNLGDMTPDQAADTLSDLGLYMEATGASKYYTDATKVYDQSVAAGEEVAPGTVITVSFNDTSNTDNEANVLD